jgi:hypothetical protein
VLTVAGVGSATVALQGLLGVAGTGVAILVFVVLGNPSAGGAAAPELLPGFWRQLGPLIPPGAATSAVRSVVYFPDGSLGGPLLVLLGWLVAGTLAAVAFGGRGRGLSEAEAEASAAGAAAA